MNHTALTAYLRPSSARAAAVWYTCAALLTTWPLAAGLTRDIPFDQGDSLLNSWILAWDLDHLLRFLGGDLAAFRGFWNANIFHPQPLALAYSEHLFGLALPVLPVYAVSGNIILCYNLLFLATFVLSAVGAYLLVRDMTGSAAAGFVAGFVYGFAPYRVSQFSHLQVLASHWMPFVLFGVRRYLETRRRRTLAWTATAALLQNLSCGYYMLFFPPFLAVFGLHELWRRNLLRDARVWRDLIVAGAGVTILTIPFVTPYLALREYAFPPRPIGEVVAFSADVYSYLTAHVENRLYGRFLRAHPKPEGDLFPGFVAIGLSLTALIVLVRHVARETAAIDVRYGLTARALAWLTGLMSVVLIAIFLTGGLSLGDPPFIRATNVARLSRFVLVAMAALMMLSPRARVRAVALVASPTGLFTLWAVAAWWLSLGPLPQSDGQTLAGAGAYRVLYDFVPGFDGLRVPARLAMLVMLAVAVLAGLGAARLERGSRKRAVALMVVGFFAAIEGTAVPIDVNLIGQSRDLQRARPVLPFAEAPSVYRYLGQIPETAVLAEMPFGDPAHELRYMYYSALHWRPLLNGYSGGFPPSYYAHVGALRRFGDRGWQMLVDAGTTHVVVHEGAYRAGRGTQVSRALVARGAKLEAQFGRDKVFVMPSRLE